MKNILRTYLPKPRKEKVKEMDQLANLLTMDTLKYLSPALITILANFIIMIYFKNRIDQKLEQFKITYSGIFKERIDIYRLLLKKTVEIKSQISRYGYGMGDPQKIMEEINDLINCLLINRPFISVHVNHISNNLITLFQEVFDPIYLGNKNLESGSTINEKIQNNYIKALNKLKKNEDFKRLEDLLVHEISKSLGFDKIE